MQENRAGFTLIELSIVLVIIGLISGGILFGRDIIRAAQVYRQVKQIEEFNLAANTFKLKYNCIPGDCANAEEQGLGTAGGPGENGDGDGKLFTDVFFGTVPTPVESINFWHHLSQAGLLAKEYPGYSGGSWIDITALPAPILTSMSQLNANTFAWIGNPRGGFLPINIDAWDNGTVGMNFDFSGLFENNDRNFWFLTTGLWYLTAPGTILPVDAYSIDTKMDDGMPQSGVMRSISGLLRTGRWHPADNPPNNPACVTNSAQYNVEYTNVTTSNYANLLCAPIIQTEF